MRYAVEIEVNITMEERRANARRTGNVASWSMETFTTTAESPDKAVELARQHFTNIGRTTRFVSSCTPLPKTGD